MALRRGRIDLPRAEWFLSELASLHITIEPPLSIAEERLIFTVAQTHQLTIYDAAYLELAQRTGLELATLDSALFRAAKRAQVGLVL